MQQDVALAELPRLREHLGIGGEIAAREHRALGSAGGAGGVDDGRRRTGAPGPGRSGRGSAMAHEIGQRPLAVRAEGFDVRHAGTLGQRFDRGPLRGAHHGDPRFGVVQEMSDLMKGVRDVDRHEDGAQAQTGRVQQHSVHRLVRLDENPVARIDAARNQGRRESGRLHTEGRIGQLPAFGRSNENAPRAVARRSFNPIAGIPDRRHVAIARYWPSPPGRMMPRIHAAVLIRRRSGPSRSSRPRRRTLPNPRAARAARRGR